MDNNVDQNRFAFGSDLGKAVITGVFVGAAGVIGAGIGRMIVVQIMDWYEDNKKSNPIGFVR